MICTLDAIPVIKIEMQAANLTLIVDFALKNFFKKWDIRIVNIKIYLR